MIISREKTKKITRLTEADKQLVDWLAIVRNDPLAFVMGNYPWRTEKRIQKVKLAEPWCSIFSCEHGPDVWACEFFEALGAELRDRNFDGQHSVHPVRFARASGHGIGKSATVAQLTDFILSTRPYSKITITANTLAQLQAKTWAEISKWFRLGKTGSWFNVGSSRGHLYVTHKQHVTEWCATGQTCSEENSEAFAGQHAADATSAYIFDEASKIPDKTFEVAEGGLTDGEPMIFVFGNPTQAKGKFARIFTAEKKYWNVGSIDSRDVQITNKEKIQQDLELYGEDSDFFKVRVRGVFPSSSTGQLFPWPVINEAYGRTIHISAYHTQPIVIGGDIGRDHDPCKVYVRQGLVILETHTWLSHDDMVSADRFAELIIKHKPVMVNIDKGCGTGVIDRLRRMGFSNIMEVAFGGEASRKDRYANKRAEMYDEALQWLLAGGCLPKIPFLRDDLAAVVKSEDRTDRMILNPKDEIKEELGRSPDDGDAFVLTFAYKVFRKENKVEQFRAIYQPASVKKTYDPFSRL